jgi:hypothetical protein
VIRKISAHHLTQPSSLLWNRLVHSPSQLNLDGLQTLPHALSLGVPFQIKRTRQRLSADVREAQKVERLRFSQSTSLSTPDRKAAELDQTSFGRMQRQLKPYQPFPKLQQEALGFRLVLKTNDDVVGIAHQDDVAASTAITPSLCPQIEDIVKVDICQ